MCQYAHRHPGVRYELVCIDNASVIQDQKLDTRDKADLEAVYNWIISQLEGVASIHTPSLTTTPIMNNEKGDNDNFSCFFSRPTVCVTEEPRDQPQVSMCNIIWQKRESGLEPEGGSE